MYGVKHDDSQKIVDRSEHLAVFIEVWDPEVGGDGSVTKGRKQVYPQGKEQKAR